MGIAGFEETNSAGPEIVLHGPEAGGDNRYSERCILSQFNRQHQMRCGTGQVWHEPDIGEPEQGGQFFNWDRRQETYPVSELHAVNPFFSDSNVVATSNHGQAQCGNLLP